MQCTVLPTAIMLKTMDWELLSSTLSSEALKALKEFRSTSDQSSVNTCGENEKHLVPNSVFKSKDYWEGRFETEETYDWLVSFKHIEKHFIHELKVNDQILIVGCGNSNFSNDLYDSGFENIVNIDFSSVVIDKMSASNSEKRLKMRWICMDMLELSFPECTFDVVIDKAAMDALMVDEKDVWDPDRLVIEEADKMCRGIVRVLKPGGVFYQISFAQPHFRTKYLLGYHAEGREMDPYKSYSGISTKYNWDLTFTPIEIDGGCLNSFLYSMKII